MPTLRAYFILSVVILSRQDSYAVEDDAGRGDDKNDTAAFCQLDSAQLEANNITASLTTDRYTAQSNVSFVCSHANYTLIGAPYVLCLAHGQWDRDLPLCKYVTCPELPPPSPRVQVEIISTSFLPGTLASFHCKRGFEIDEGSSPVSRCQPNGKWTAHSVLCRAKCGPLPPVDGGSVHYNCQLEHCPAQIACNPGLRLTGDSVYTCQADGSWAPKALANCSRILCRPPPNPRNGVLKEGKESYEPGDEAHFHCVIGYRMHGDGKLVCLSDGTWAASQMQCKHEELSTQATSTPCGSPSVVPGATFTVDAQRVAYKCSEGLHLYGKDTVLCLSTGKWDSNPPECTDAHPDASLQLLRQCSLWSGSYTYANESYPFQLWVAEKSADNAHLPTDAMYAKMVEKVVGGGRLSLQAFVEESYVIFRVHGLMESNERFKDIGLKVKGQLMVSEKEGQCFYEGDIQSEDKQFTTWRMKSTMTTERAGKKSGEMSPSKANFTALVLGVAIAFGAILFAALLAALCAKRKGALNRFGHRTLDTSFENPVYEYEQNIK